MCQLLPRVLSRCLDTLCVRKASLLDLFRADLTRLTTTLAADVLTIDDVGFSVKDIGRLEGVLRSHVHNKAFIKKYGARAANGGSKVNFVLGLSKVRLCSLSHCVLLHTFVSVLPALTYVL